MSICHYNRAGYVYTEYDCMPLGSFTIGVALAAESPIFIGGHQTGAIHCIADSARYVKRAGNKSWYKT